MLLYDSQQVRIVPDADGVPAAAALPNQLPPTVKTDATVRNPVEEKPEPAKPVVENTERRGLAQTFAEFPGGEAAFHLFVRNNLKYPEDLKANEQKRVIVSFVVDATGAWHRIELQTSAGKDLDKEIRRVLKKMPRWKPATQNGIAVRTEVVYPLVIDGADKKKK
jgi:protein TonB